MFGIFPLTPAYGRDYKNRKEVLKDYFAGKDFKTTDCQYCSCRDFRDNNAVPIRFNKLADVCIIDGTSVK